MLINEKHYRKKPAQSMQIRVLLALKTGILELFEITPRKYFFICSSKPKSKTLPGYWEINRKQKKKCH